MEKYISFEKATFQRLPFTLLEELAARYFLYEAVEDQAGAACLTLQKS